MIDTVLEDAKKYWEKNSKAREYIESGAQSMLTAESPKFPNVWEFAANKNAPSQAETCKGAYCCHVRRFPFPTEEVAKAVGAGVRAAIKTAVEAVQGAPSAKPSDGDATESGWIEADEELGCGFSPAGAYDETYREIDRLREELAQATEAPQGPVSSPRDGQEAPVV